MHNYVLWRAIGAVLAASGVAAVVAAFALPPGASNDLRGALAVYGFGALIFGGVGALWAQTRMRVEDARANGGDVQAAATGDPRWRGGALVVVGVALIAEGFDWHVPRGYIYFAMAFSTVVEMLNIRMRKKARPVKLHKTIEEK